MLLGKFRIQGHSMMPILNPNETIIVSSIPYFFSNPKVGDIVVVYKGSKTFIKRIKTINGEDIYLRGDNKDDSLEIGIIKRKNIIGKYIIKI